MVPVIFKMDTFSTNQRIDSVKLMVNGKYMVNPAPSFLFISLAKQVLRKSLETQR